MEWLRKNWTLALLILAGVIIFFLTNPFGCNKPLPPTIVTTHDTTTVMVPQPPVIIPQYVPMPVYSQAPAQLPAGYQNLPTEVAKLQQMVTELANKYYATNTYKDSIPLRDSTGRRVGVVNLEDLVSENTIKLRKPSYQLTLPVTTITNTTTITQAYQPKRQLFVGGEVVASRYDPLKGAFVGVQYKNKKDQIYTFKVGGLNEYSSTNTGVKSIQFYGQIGTYWKLGRH